ncbi:uncharacterized protein LOC135476796 [Liolophura sinensis]|uniref:uncharacterized protein LOC135476796 n=1 Tax=Liolophura sinensis TaxID=3198878 RepID=UPI0031585E53
MDMKETPLVAYLLKEGAVLPTLAQNNSNKGVVTSYLRGLTKDDTALIEVILEGLSGEERNEVIENAHLSDYLSPEAMAQIRSAPGTVLSLEKHCRKAIRRSLNMAAHRRGMSASIRQLSLLPKHVQGFLMMNEVQYNLARVYGYGYYDDDDDYDDYNDSSYDDYEDDTDSEWY